ncbi:MAG: LacI family DNA-binding transcriptional regulator [Clostridia bacterium]|nr:LacI family DNA-binding transcriptional regulator [Clostridia bacterium]
MTLSKLAQLAHVSVSTVSKAFSASREVSAETRKYIFDVAKQHGCFEKYYKENYDKKVVAIICPELCSEYYSNLATCIEKRLSEMDCTSLLSVTNFDLQREMDIINYYRCFAKVNGIILLDGTRNLPVIENVPCVGIGKFEERCDMDSVIIEDDGLEQAVCHLKENGHKDIAFFGEKLTLAREKKFIELAIKHGITVRDECVFRSDLRFEKAGEWCAEQLLKLDKKPTAFFAAYDYIALGAINKLKSKGYLVPKDFSAVSTNNIQTTEYEDIKLTSVKTNSEKIADIAIDFLFERMENIGTEHKTAKIKTELVERNSVTKI